MFTNKDYVYTVYKLRSFSKAAEKLFISQPSLSATIKRIEERLGAALFDRSVYPIQLTDCGAEYIRCVERIQDIENGFHNYINNLNTMETGSLTIGAPSFFASFILPSMIAEFQARYPKIKTELLESNTIELEKLLRTGDVDLIVDNTQYDDVEFAKRPFYRERLVLSVPEPFIPDEQCRPYALSRVDILSDRHLDEQTPAIPLQLFKDSPFVLLKRGNDTRLRADRICDESRIEPRVVLQLDQLSTAYQVSCHGMGITFVSDALIKQVVTDHKIAYFKIDSAHTLRQNWFYYRHNKYVTKAMDAFLAIAQM